MKRGLNIITSRSASEWVGGVGLGVDRVVVSRVERVVVRLIVLFVVVV